MTYFVVGLGNPGEEYENTRHNVGRMVAERVAEELQASDWRSDKKLRAQVVQAATKTGDTVKIILPDNYMNRSGGAVAPLVKNAKQAERLVVVQDDIDLPLGMLRIVFNRGAGGHRGVDSIVRTLKTKAFVRVRVGVIPTTPAGKSKKPQGEQKVYDFILKQLTKKDREELQKHIERATKAVITLVEEGREVAMQEFNGDGSKKKKQKKKKSARPVRKTATRK